MSARNRKSLKFREFSTPLKPYVCAYADSPERITRTNAAQAVHAARMFHRTSERASKANILIWTSLMHSRGEKPYEYTQRDLGSDRVRRSEPTQRMRGFHSDI